jgi:hypothetical protein
MRPYYGHLDPGAPLPIRAPNIKRARPFILIVVFALGKTVPKTNNHASLKEQNDQLEKNSNCSLKKLFEVVLKKLK